MKPTRTLFSALALFASAIVALSTPLMAQSSKTHSSKTYRNPIIDRIGPADPHVIRHDGKYYMYPTLDGKGYDVFVSDDLVHWDQRPKCFSDARGGAWAPDVFHHKKGDGRFYLYYTVNKPGGGKQIGVAVADGPLGPFKDHANLVDSAPEIDGRTLLILSCAPVSPVKICPFLRQQ